MAIKIISNKKGFTIIELLVVLAIMNIIISGAFSMFFFGNKTFETGTEQNNSQSSARIAGDFIEKKVKNSTYLEIVTVPANSASILNTDSYNYLFIQGGMIVYSEYNSGGSRKVSQISSNLLNSSKFYIYSQSTSKQILGFLLIGSAGGQNYQLDSKINLVNFNLMNPKTEIQGTAATAAVRFKIDKAILIAPSPTPTPLATVTPSPSPTTSVTTSPTPIPTPTPTPSPAYYSFDFNTDGYNNPRITFYGSTYVGTKSNKNTLTFPSVLTGLHAYTLEEDTGKGIYVERLTGTIPVDAAHTQISIKK